VATENGGMCDDRMIVEVLQGWIDEDRKHTALKALQGMVWPMATAARDFTAHIYPDAAPAIERVAGAGLTLYVYSSGSVPAQRLFFGHSDAGDLTPLFSGWFDTEVGGKREPQLSPHRRGDRRTPQQTSSSCPTSWKNSMRPAKPASPPC
jgi:enolase-phosphatase E1